jgi:hypothetical protein
MRLARLAQMDGREIAWRVRAAARTAFDRAMFAAARPKWDRRALADILARHTELDPARDLLSTGDWNGAERVLARHFAAREPRFLIAPAFRSDVAAAVRREFARSEPALAARADRIIAGEYDLLGYRGLRFDGWNHDPIHDRRPPAGFWTTVPFLDPSCGDHKIIWELNRQQHFLALGQAFWLTGDRKYRDRFVKELRSWLRDNPPLTGINWASMLELAFRSLSWLWALHFFAVDAADDDPWIVDLLVGLHRQLTHVERNLSHYFSPNTHLLGEALALYVCGRALPELAASTRWATVGRRILIREIGRQIGVDGVHKERSTHYHRYTLDFYLLALAVARITGDEVSPEFERAAARLALAARLLTDDRGRMPHIGDDDGGRLAPLGERAVDDVRDTLGVATALLERDDLAIGPSPVEALWWLAHPMLRPHERHRAPAHTIARAASISAALPDGGYYVSRSPRSDHLVVDGGQHGYQNGGHAHADALAITFTVGGVPLLTDCGTGCYTTDPSMRDRLRSSAMHNTVVVDERSQSMPSGPFHWSHVAAAAVRRWRMNDGFDYFDGAHDGYRPLIHRRHVLAMHGDLLIVADLIEGSETHTAAVHWHIDPRWAVDANASRAVFRSGAERVELVVPSGVLERFVADEATGLGWHSPVYGRIEPTTTLRATHTGAAPFWMVSVFGLDSGNSVRSAEIVPVWAEAGALAQSIGLRIDRDVSTDFMLVAEPTDGAPAETTCRLADFETDARMLFCRVTEDRPVARVALVDGSIVRTSSRRGFQLKLPRAAPDLHLDLRADPRIAGALFGAKLVVGGLTRTVSVERRATARSGSGTQLCP